MAGREGGGSGGIMHHGECEWVQRSKNGERRQYCNIEMSCMNSHLVASEVECLFYGTSLTQDTVQDITVSDTAQQNMSAEDTRGLCQCAPVSLNTDTAKPISPFSVHITKMQV